jgi:chemosensory pili system protein ChpC
MATTQNIASLMIPMWGEPILIPNTAVAEVIGFVMPEGGDGKDFIGFIKWRGLSVPVINLEPDAPPVDDIGRAARIAVFNSATGNQKMSFIAVLVNGIPRLNNIREDDLKYTEDDETMTDGIKARVLLGQEVVRLIDLPKLEKMAIKFIKAADKAKK